MQTNIILSLINLPSREFSPQSLRLRGCDSRRFTLTPAGDAVSWFAAIE
jgi:hypothetical protein